MVWSDGRVGRRLLIKVTDYIADKLVEAGIRHVFMITGGGAMHLNDSLGHHPDLAYVANHHEQACAIAAEGYQRASGRMAAVNVTTGPGGTNALTGVLGQWVDSIPAIYVSGQVKQETTVSGACPDVGLRQLGDQEAPIMDIVRPITKLAVTVRRPADIRWVLEKALFLATDGRPGPVWIDVPMDVQGARVDPGALRPYEPRPGPGWSVEELRARVSTLVDRLRDARRPVLLAGHGIRLAGAQEALFRVAGRLGIPVLCTFNGFDLMPSDHHLFIGRPSTIGTRAGNFALQNADLLLSVGSRNNIRQVSYTWRAYARAAYKVIVDVDGAELKKPTVVPDLPIHADAGAFLGELERQLADTRLPSYEAWVGWCVERRERYAVVPFDQRQEGPDLNPYVFMQALGRQLPSNAVVVAGDGTACVALFQAGIVKRGQRQFWNSGCAAMGYDLPAAIGAAFARPGEDVICLAGDGSLQLNIQELQTLVHHRLPIKLFVLSNEGYQSIRQTQEAYFDAKFVAASADSGLTFPDITRVAEAYGLPAHRIAGPERLDAAVCDVLRIPGPVVCDVRLDTTYSFKPKLSSQRRDDGTMVSKPLEDLAPLLPRDEFARNMLVAPWEEP